MIGSGVGFLYNQLDFGVPVRPAARRAAGARRATSPSSRSTSTALEHASGSASSAWGCPRPPTWPRSPAPASCRSTRARPRPPQALGMTAGQDDAPRRAPPGDARHRAADRQRDDRHGQGHLAALGDPRHHRAVLPDATSFGTRSFQIMPGFVAATVWYLIVCSILMVGQSCLEQHFGRGFGAGAQEAPQRQARRESGGRPLMSDADDRHGTDARAPADQPLVHAVNVTKALPRHRGAQGHRHGRAPRRGRRACSAPRARARRPSCAASTSSRPSTAAASGSTATSMGYDDRRRHAAPPHRQADRRPAPRHRHGASSGSTSSRT